MDRFGHPVVPRERFLVPLFVINEAVDRIKDGSIAQYSYDSATAKPTKFQPYWWAFENAPLLDPVGDLILRVEAWSTIQWGITTQRVDN